MPYELDKLNEKRRELIERVKAAEAFKSEVVRKVQKLISEYNAGELSHREYKDAVEKAFGERTPEQWVEYYDDYIVKCKGLLEVCEREIKKIKIKLNIFPVLLIFGGLLVLFFVLPYFEEERVFFAPPDVYTQGLNINTNESMTYNWILENQGTLGFVKVSGLVEGDGEVLVYLVSSSGEFLILDSVSLGIQLSPGLALGGEEKKVKGDGIPEPEPEPIPEPEDNETTPDDNETIPPEPEPPEDNETLPDVNITLPDANITVPDENITEEPEENVTIREFFELCEETCDLSGLNLSEDSYELRIEVSGARLELETLTYEILAEEEPLPPENVTNITLPDINITEPPINDTDVTKHEEKTPRGKKVVVSGPDGLVDVPVSVDISKKWKVRDADSILVRWVEGGVDMELTTVDLKDGLVSKVEWVVPHLSNQTFEIIIITKASHLDSNREFISNIYEEVRELDGVWSEEIANQDYVRVKFEQALTSGNDITLYPNVLNGNPRIEVYEVDGTEKIAEFESLSEGENSVLLSGLVGEQDEFDLRVLGGSVEIDYIVDPTGYIVPDSDIDVSWSVCEPPVCPPNFVYIDEGTPPDIGDYLKAEETGETFGMTTLSNVGTISAINVRVYMERDGGGTRLLATISPDGTNWETPVDQAAPNTATWVDFPFSGLSWTQSDLDNMQVNLTGSWGGN